MRSMFNRVLCKNSKPYVWLCIVFMLLIGIGSGPVLLGQELPHGEALAAKAKNVKTKEVAQAKEEKADEGKAVRGAPGVARAPQRAPQQRTFQQGALIRVRLPILGTDDEMLKQKIEHVVERLLKNQDPAASRRPILVLEFAPRKNSKGLGGGFERSLAVARYLLTPKISAVKVVAYVPKTIQGHGVLILSACEEIIMAAEAEFGNAGADEPKPVLISRNLKQTYLEIGQARRTIPAGLLVGMLDPEAEIFKVETADAVEFVTSQEFETLKGRKPIVRSDLIVPRGTTAVFTGRQAYEYGFVNGFAKDHKSLAKVLRLTLDDVTEDLSLGHDWNPVMFTLEGPVTPARVAQLQAMLQDEIQERKVNWIGLRINSAGGDLESGISLAETLAALRKKEIRTVAYVPNEARGVAAIIALSAEQMVLHTNAKIGLAMRPDRAPAEVEATLLQLSNLGKTLARSPAVLQAMLDPQVSLFVYHQTQTGEQVLSSEKAISALPEAALWRRGAPFLAPVNGLFELTADQALEHQLAWKKIENYAQLQALYRFKNAPREAVPNKILELVAALATPTVAGFLLSCAFVGLYLEVYAPGIGLGGFLSAFCFLLFFWSQMLNGTADWLEIILFCGGIIFLLLEIFVIPGFGIFGVGGGLMVLASLILSVQGFTIPTNSLQLQVTFGSIVRLILSFGSSFLMILMIRPLLPYLPIFRAVIMVGPNKKQLAEQSAREAMTQYDYLVGMVGVTQTRLMPSGKAVFQGEMQNVISAAGEAFDPGTEVQVSHVLGNQIYVHKQ